LGLKLDKTVKAALVESAATNVWTDPSFNLSSLAGKNSDITEGTYLHASDSLRRNAAPAGICA
jgi:hypothetical protein